MANVCVFSDNETRNDFPQEERTPAAVAAATAEDIRRGSDRPAPERRGGNLVRVEANFLRLPLFALDTKQMRRMDGIRCEGTFRRSGERFPFTFVATRNVRTLYPGPVARAAHLAILSLATEGGLPVENPIVFSWRDLLGRMGVSVSGRTVSEVKRALLATKGLMIESRHALYSKAEGRPLDTGSELNQVVGLYDELEFFGTQRPDQTVADVNAVWLSRWYLANLNALYSGPLDFTLWRQLDRKSPIASRLYEFLFLKFFAGRETLRFNYSTLVKFIPARRERYLSDAKKQLQPALTLLTGCGVLADARWSASREGEPQLHLRRGKILRRTADTRPAGYDVGEEDFVLDQIQNVRLPEWEVVEDFHRQRGHPDYRPSRAELQTARDLLGKYGKGQLRELIPLVVTEVEAKWPEAKTFVAAARYVDDALNELRRKQERDVRVQQEAAKAAGERAQEARREERQAALKARWEALDEMEREAIRQDVLGAHPGSLRKYPVLLDRLCLEELARRHDIDPHP